MLCPHYSIIHIIPGIAKHAPCVVRGHIPSSVKLSKLVYILTMLYSYALGPLSRHARASARSQCYRSTPLHSGGGHRRQPSHTTVLRSSTTCVGIRGAPSSAGKLINGESGGLRQRRPSWLSEEECGSDEGMHKQGRPSITRNF